MKIDRDHVVRLRNKEYEGDSTLRDLIPCKTWEESPDLTDDDWNRATRIIYALLAGGEYGHVDTETSLRYVYIDRKGAAHWIDQALERERKIRINIGRKPIPDKKELYPPDGETPDYKAGRDALAKVVREMELDY